MTDLSRRLFLKRTSLAIVSGLLVGDAALELFERLTHRPVFALGGLPQSGGRLIADGGYESWCSTEDVNPYPEAHWQVDYVHINRTYRMSKLTRIDRNYAFSAFAS